MGELYVKILNALFFFSFQNERSYSEIKKKKGVRSRDTLTG